MNKKFLNLFLIGALVVVFAGLAVSCKDYDDDIVEINGRIDKLTETVNALQSQISAGAVITSVSQTANGIKVTLSNGNSYDVLNGKDGADGQPGTIITIGENGNWFIDGEDTGKPAAGKDGVDGKDGEPAAQIYYKPGKDGKWIKVTVKPGEEPVEEATEESCFPAGTLTAVWDPETNSLAIYNAEGADGPIYVNGGIASISYRLQASDPSEEVATAYHVVYSKGTNYPYSYSEALKEDLPLTKAPVEVSFKVSPATFDVEKASFSFVDVHATKGAPAFSYVGEPVLKDGILSLNMVPNENVKSGQGYATALEITLNNKATTSDEFRAMVKAIDVEAVTNVKIEKDKKGNLSVGDAFGKNELLNLQGEYEVAFDGSLDFNEIISAAIDNTNIKEFLSKMGVAYEQEFTLASSKEAKWNGKAVKEGVFDLTDGVLSVKGAQQSAIGGFAIVKVATTVKSTYEGVNDYKLADAFVSVKVVRTPAAPEKPAYIALQPSKASDDFSFSYDAKDAQKLALDWRAFENVMGRDNLLKTWNNGSYTASLYYATKFDKNSGEPVEYSIAANDVRVEFTTSGTNADDELTLIVPAKTILPEATYYLGGHNYVQTRTDIPEYTFGGKKYVLAIEGLSVVRSGLKYSIIKGFEQRMVIGDISNKFVFASPKFDKMYETYPSDMNLGFMLSDEQDPAVQDLIDYNVLTFDGNSLKLDSFKDFNCAQANYGDSRKPEDIQKAIRALQLDKLAKVNVVLFDDLDMNGVLTLDANYRPVEEILGTEVWGFQDPIADSFVGGADALKPISDPKWDDNTKLTVDQWSDGAFDELTKTVTVGTTTKTEVVHKKLTLSDNFSTSRVCVEGSADGVDATQFGSDNYGFEIAWSVDPETNWSIDAKTGALSFKGVTPGTLYEEDLKITITATYNWGKVTKTMTLHVARK